MTGEGKPVAEIPQVSSRSPAPSPAGQGIWRAAAQLGTKSKKCRTKMSDPHGQSRFLIFFARNDKGQVRQFGTAKALPFPVVLEESHYFAAAWWS